MTEEYPAGSERMGARSRGVLFSYSGENFEKWEGDDVGAVCSSDLLTLFDTLDILNQKPYIYSEHMAYPHWCAQEAARRNTMGKKRGVHKFSVTSFFCGCGGLDLGFRGGFTYHGERYRRLPFDIKAAYDINEPCVETYNRYFGKKHAEKIDLSTANTWNFYPTDLLIGGFPCQEFSSCGPLGGLESDRGKLYRVMIQYMKAHRPKVVVGENVINLMRMDDGNVIETITSDLKKAGYKVRVWNMYAPDYGVPQSRERLFFVCVRNGIPGFPKQPTPLFKDNPRSIEWAIGDLERVADNTVPNQGQYFVAARARHGNGQGDEVSQRDKPAYTIRANPKSRVQFHYALDRRLTVRECARIQTFPDDFTFEDSMTASISQIGNAVPPILGYTVATAVAEFMSGLGG